MPPFVLTTLTDVSVKSVWPSEPYHFTPWLLANSQVLGMALGLDDLELERAEHPVGNFSLDLIGRTTHSDEVVIVENQFGPTDHQHLGQIMTYAGGTRPQYIVWIAEKFRDEHRAALDWLNGRTDSETRFFGIELRVVALAGVDAIGAPLLEVVVQPNEWGKAVKSSTSTVESPRAKLYRDFWSRLLERIEPLQWTASKGTADSFLTMSAKSTAASYCLQFTVDGVQSELRLESSDAEVNTARFNELLRHEAQMIASYGEGLVFDPVDGYKVCKLVDRLPNASVVAIDSWDAIIDWMLSSQRRLRAAIAEVGGIPPAVL